MIHGGISSAHSDCLGLRHELAREFDEAITIRIELTILLRRQLTNLGNEQGDPHHGELCPYQGADRIQCPGGIKRQEASEDVEQLMMFTVRVFDGVELNAKGDLSDKVERESHEGTVKLNRLALH